MQRLRFEHPEVRVVVLRSGKDNVFCAGANIRMLAKASHAHKVNFCKFTNETRCAIEDAGENSGQRYLAAVSGACAGGGYEIAMTAEHIMLIDDRRSTVALPETPLLAVLPGTGGLTRLTDKRRVRRDLADMFCSLEEGIRGRRAVDWRLVDEVVPPLSALGGDSVREAGDGVWLTRPDRPGGCDAGVALTPPRGSEFFEGDAVALRACSMSRCDRRQRGAGDRDGHCAGRGRVPADLARRSCGRGRGVLASAGGARTG